MPGGDRTPAKRFLPSEESWRPRTWRHFRYALLRHLQDQGAHSLEDLTADPPEVLHLGLNRTELLAVIDSSWRKGLIRRFDTATAGGPIASRDGWAVTEDGQRTIRHGLPWIFDKLDLVPKMVSLIAALLGTAIVGNWLRSRSETEIAIIAGFGLLAFLALFALRSHAAGANARRAASRDWKRWQNDRPEWSKIAQRRFPWWAAAAPLVAVSVVVLLAKHVSGALVEQFGALLVIFAWTPLLGWFSRWDEIERKAKEREGNS